MEYSDRSIYRNFYSSLELIPFNVKVKETDLYILADIDLSSFSLASVVHYRSQIEEYIHQHDNFYHSFQPVNDDQSAPFIIREMISASRIAGVGPMASVAGTIADFVGRDLLLKSRNIIVENGGDIFIKLESGENRVGIFAGNSQLSSKVALRIKAEDTPLGICTSSGTIGHSLSFGNADAVCVISKKGSLSDAAATAIGNMVDDPTNIEGALVSGSRIDGVLGIVIIIGDKMGAWGQIEFSQ